MYISLDVCSINAKQLDVTNRVGLFLKTTVVVQYTENVWPSLIKNFEQNHTVKKEKELIKTTCSNTITSLSSF